MRPRYHPGEAVLRMADIALIAKSDTATPAQIAQLVDSVRALNPRATILRGASPVTLEGAAALAGKRVLVIEDGPTITHGGMPHGAGWRAATDAGAEIVDPRPWAGPELQACYRSYPHIGPVLPALGYYAAQIEALRDCIDACDADAVVSGTPIDLAALLVVNKPVLRARYEFADVEQSRTRRRAARIPARAGPRLNLARGSGFSRTDVGLKPDLAGPASAGRCLDTTRHVRMNSDPRACHKTVAALQTPVHLPRSRCVKTAGANDAARPPGFAALPHHLAVRHPPGLPPLQGGFPARISRHCPLRHHLPRR